MKIIIAFDATKIETVDFSTRTGLILGKYQLSNLDLR